MPRYFIELSYKGTLYSGFQSQSNAKTIQAEVEKAIYLLGKQKITLTGSSRTDAGVHAAQNFFHFDLNNTFLDWRGIDSTEKLVYKLNALLPPDIVIIAIHSVAADAHCRFDALSREYNYHIYQNKNPFLSDRAFYYPYKLDIDKLKMAAALIEKYEDFTTFSKRNTQVKSFKCQIIKSEWNVENEYIIYSIVANRFLRGMVRAITATMLKVGRGNLSINDLQNIILAKDCTKASFAIPPQGLILSTVNYPEGYFKK